MQKQKFLIIYGLLGLLLVFGYQLLPDLNEFTSEDLAVHKKTLLLTEKIATTTWANFSLSQIPIAYRKGKTEYLVQNDQILYSRDPFLPVMAATAYPVDGQMQAFVPTKHEMDLLGGFVESFGENNRTESLVKQFSFQKKSAMAPELYQAVIIHETFHVFQLNNWDLEEYLEPYSWLRLSDDEDETIKNKLFQLTENPQLYYLLREEGKMLARVISATTREEALGSIKHFFEIRDQRHKKMATLFSPKEYRAICYLEEYYELYEGTATYMMVVSLRESGNTELVQDFLHRLENVEKGKDRYYTLGMGMALALDKWSLNKWHNQLFTPQVDHISLEELIAQVLK